MPRITIEEPLSDLMNRLHAAAAQYERWNTAFQRAAVEHQPIHVPTYGTFNQDELGILQAGALRELRDALAALMARLGISKDDL